MDHYDRVVVLPDAFDWADELMRELAEPHAWEAVAGYLDVECAERLVSADYYDNRQGDQLFVRDLPAVWMRRLRELIERTTGYAGPLMQPRVIIYREGQEFREHTDFPHLRDGHVRTHTLCAYLTEPEGGGELDFNHGVTIRPKPGLAVVFDPTFVHRSTPVQGAQAKVLIVTWFVAEDEPVDGEVAVIHADQQAGDGGERCKTTLSRD